MIRSRMDAWRLALVGLLLSMLVALAVPTQSHAWAWKDVCIADVYNASGGTARMVFWIPIPPIPSNLQLLPGYIAVGMPTGTEFGLSTNNTGTPVTWGCHGTMSYASPLGVASCAYSAPTKGANSFDCKGNFGLRTQADDDNIWVHVGLPITPPGAAAAEAPDPTADTTPTIAQSAQAKSVALTDADLAGAWKTTNDLASASPIGTAWTAGTESASCRADQADKHADVPGYAGQWLVGPDGDLAGSSATAYDTVAAANRTYDTAMSRTSIGCLAGLIESGVAAGGGHADTTITALDRGDPGDESAAYRIAVAATAADGSAWNGTLDVLGAREGGQLSLLFFSSVGDAPSTAVEGSAFAAMDTRMNR